LLLLDLRGKNLNGKQACADLESVGIATNKNGIPFDPLPPTVTSGIRLGTPALTTRRFQQEECKYVASLMDQAMTKTLDAEQLKLNVQELCKRFPIYS
ncbi:MAG TPA: serine hydroxymethyltransferase, partial [Alphaproteobacteria bacterium]|nr:serine hydroxymethyltransferase [Alphaproteobacteria bacterium]